MDIRLLILLFLAPSLPVFTSGLTYPDLESPVTLSRTYTYNRFSEIYKHCSSVLPSPFELIPDDNRFHRIKTELSFLNGDWDQESNSAPLMPYDVSDMWLSDSISGSILKLASFWVMDVDPVRRSENLISVSGIMHVSITRDISFSYGQHTPEPEQSKISILFEGVYMESEENGGERLMCLLGTSMRPISNQAIDFLEPVNGYDYTYNQEPPLVQDDQIMLILRYPKTFTLTTRGVRGEMKSLNNKFDRNYFNGVQISSQLGCYSKYEFGSEEVFKACSPYPYQDNLVDENVRMFKGEEFCGNLQYFLSSGIFNLVPSWESVGTNHSGRLGPFVLSKEIKATIDSNLDNFRLLVERLHCEPEIEQNKIKNAKVAAVFRVTHLSGWRYISDDRTGLSSRTLSAEGIWTPSSGQLCMVGCLGLFDATSNTCSSRICLYLPLTISITQRSILYGTISSINETETHNSLLFEKVTRPTDFFMEYQWNKDLKWSYKYSKLIQASGFQTRSEPSMLGTKFRKSLLIYPSFHGSDNVSLSHLSDELSIRSSAVPNSFNNAQAYQTYVEIEVLSLGSLFGRWKRQEGQAVKYEKQMHSSAERTEISGHLTATGANNISLFIEGLYDPVVGKMYLIGCKDVRAFQKIINSSMNLERGMDCQIEIKIDYPAKNARWLLNPKVIISISSKRSEEDSLHFSPISLETFPINYKEQEDDMLFQKGLEVTLWVLMLLMTIIWICWQLRYIGIQEEACTCISLVMLGIQVLSYSIPLISGNDILFKWKEFQYRMYGRMKYRELEELDLIINTLLLSVLIANARLYGKVRASRVSLTSTHAGKRFGFPSDKLVLLITLAIHILGFSILHIVREVNATTQSVPKSGFLTNTSSTTIQNLLKWVGELNDYSVLIQELFLLPQIISNILWRIQVKPLSKPYYFGFTTMRVLFHAYNYIRDPVFYPTKDFQYSKLKNPTSDINSKLGNIAIAVTMIVLAMIVHIQQRGTDHKVSQTAKPADHVLESELHKSLLS